MPAATPVPFVCPECHGNLDTGPSTYTCPSCARVYPVIDGIPDFRLKPDRYLSIDEDRAKGLAVVERASSYADALRVYYGMVDDLPEWRKQKYIVRKLREREIGEQTWLDAGMPPGPFLDVGCGTGGLALAAAKREQPVVAVEAAFRWLAIARMQAGGADVSWVCANAEALPFADGAFPSVAAIDLVEHVVEPSRALREMHRVLAGGAGRLYLETNNALSWLHEPHVRLPGVGWLPRARQLRYVRWARGMDYSRVRLLRPGELRKLAAEAGLTAERLEAAPMRGAPAWVAALDRGLGSVPGYNRIAPRTLLSARKERGCC